MPATAPRPAIEFLPPIIVQEKEDDGASIITMPLDVPFHESTLVLAGRRRAKRWVPLGGAVAAAVGTACLASALTALLVRTPPAPPRIVEKRILVPTPATPAVVEVAVPAVRGAPTQEVAEAPKPTAVTGKAAPSPEPEKVATSERSSAKGDASGSVARAPRKEDASGLDQATSPPPRRELRAGFPTNPGF